MIEISKIHLNASSVHVLTFTQDQVVEMLLSVYLCDRTDMTPMTISNFRNLCNMRLSQEYHRQQREARA